MNDLIDLFSQITVVFLGIFIEAVPFLLLGTLASGLVEVFFNQEELTRLIPRRPVLAALTGSLLGLFIPVCECGVVPLTRRLFQKGIPTAAGISFLLAAPVLNPVVIASTYAAFGLGPVFWGRLGLTLGIAVITGLVFSRQTDLKMILIDGVKDPALSAKTSVAVQNPPLPPLRKGGKNPPTLFSYPPFEGGVGGDSLLGASGRSGGEIPCELILAQTGTPTLSARFRRAALIAGDEFFEMGRYLVIGALLAALLQTLVPQTFLAGLGRGPVLSVIVMAAIAVLLSVCSTVDAFIALAFVGRFASGALLSFLVYGPMVDIKSTLMFARVFRRRSVVYLVLLPLLLTLVSTAVWNLLFP
jgi:uncharacterized membrane protein YraQ (UPF0718 family)